MSRVIAVAVALVSLCLACASSAPDPAPRDPVFLGKDAIPVTSLLAPFPAAGTAESDQDFHELLQFQDLRSKRDCERVVYEGRVTLETFFGPKYGPLSEDEVRRWNSLFNDVRMDTDYFVAQGKQVWKRPRPYLTHYELHPCAKLEVTDAYPSGHAAISEAFAQVLAKLAPERAGLFQERARQIAEDRVIGGVHHPSDIEAGRRLGDAVFEALNGSPRFNAALGQGH